MRSSQRLRTFIFISPFLQHETKHRPTYTSVRLPVTDRFITLGRMARFSVYLSRFLRLRATPARRNAHRKKKPLFFNVPLLHARVERPHHLVDLERQ